MKKSLLGLLIGIVLLSGCVRICCILPLTGKWISRDGNIFSMVLDSRPGHAIPERIGNINREYRAVKDSNNREVYYYYYWKSCGNYFVMFFTDYNYGTKEAFAKETMGIFLDKYKGGN